eukprot:Plantae.Rhodophyta-Hildenbrandia_rubra.ctg6604.p1 GENE.Plantae.Rhodophyta-Hildenbrandia_rubra.ctg6604~~Plantae.Rhodophyta-Hildenbrandia_rubra.ctg6604.p1  ORF type:complete len:1007 (+),score=113.50 Plantae.Rhodophyta-Hildenbrandia_rubra.ctg6604:450-3023(+)
MVDFYLDSIFHPNLSKSVLAQEGCHLELLSKDGQPALKGVVYNEMKGLYSIPEIFSRCVSQRFLLPDTPYTNECGGLPRDIPSLCLNWSQLYRFYEQHYHPSNALLWFYGDDPEPMRLAKAAEVLSEFEQGNVSSAITLQTQWKEPRRFTCTYDVGSDNDMWMATVSWALIDPSLDNMRFEGHLAISILYELLLSTSSSPLRRALLACKLGSTVTEWLDDEARQLIFSVGLKGMKEDGVRRIEDVVLNSLRDTWNAGFSKNAIEAALNTAEFRLLEANPRGYPRGLYYARKIRATWIHNADPLKPLRYREALSSLRKRLADNESVFEDLMGKHLVGNPHRALIIFKPDQEFAVKEEAWEHEDMKKKLHRMTRAEIESLVETSNRLRAKPKEPDSYRASPILPRLTINDLSPSIKTIPMHELEELGVKILHYPLSTNGIFYVDIFFDLSKLSSNMLPYASLLAGDLTELGVSTSLKQRIARETGGIESSTWVSQVIESSGNGPTKLKLVLRAKALAKKAPKLLDLMQELLFSVDFSNRQRLLEYLNGALDDVATKIRAGREWSRLDAMFCSSGSMREQLGCVEYLTALQSIIPRVDFDWKLLLEELNTARNLIFSRKQMVISVTGAENDFHATMPALISFLASIPEQPGGKIQACAAAHASMKKQNELFIIRSATNHVGKAMNLFSLGLEPSGAYSVATRCLQSLHIWEKVRIQGGAYGAFCRFEEATGVFRYRSFCDPNIKKTLDIFDQGGKFLAEEKVSDIDILEHIIGTIRVMDRHQLEHEKGFSSAIRFLRGETDRYRQSKRNEILATSREDFKNFGEFLQKMKDNGAFVVFGAASAIEQARKEGVEGIVRSIS